jgi:hypothetical protein
MAKFVYVCGEAIVEVFGNWRTLADQVLRIAENVMENAVGTLVPSIMDINNRIRIPVDLWPRPVGHDPNPCSSGDPSSDFMLHVSIGMFNLVVVI